MDVTILEALLVNVWDTKVRCTSAAGSAFGFLGILLSVPAMVVTKILIEELWFRRLEEDHKAQEGTD